MFQLEAFLYELEEEREFLINQLANSFEKDDLLNLSGRIYQVNKIIKRIYEMEGV